MGRNNVLLRKRNLVTQSLFSFGAHARPRGHQVRRARAAWLLGNSYFVLGTRARPLAKRKRPRGRPSERAGPTRLPRAGPRRTETPFAPPRSCVAEEDAVGPGILAPL